MSFLSVLGSFNTAHCFRVCPCCDKWQYLVLFLFFFFNTSSGEVWTGAAVVEINTEIIPSVKTNYRMT